MKNNCAFSKYKTSPTEMTIDASRNNDNVAFASASIILVASRKREKITPDFLVEKRTSADGVHGQSTVT